MSVQRRNLSDAVFEEILAWHLVAFREAQHLPAQRGQPAVEAVELVDQIFDLGLVELDAFDLKLTTAESATSG